MGQVLTVALLWERIGERLAPLTERPFALRGRVADLKPAGIGAHRYFTLADAESGGARISAVIWRSKVPAIDGALRAAKLGPLANDMEIVVRGRLSPYPPSGRLSLVVEEVDAEATRQLARLQLEAIRAALRAEGIFDANHRRPVPLVPLRLALVTSEQGTVRHDVRTALEEERYRFDVRLYPAPVTGVEAAQELARMIRIADRGGHDLILLVRGGGSESELGLFDQEAVVRAVASARTPVWCAIGHAADEVLVNEVANRAFPVPRAVGVAVRERVEQFLAELVANGARGAQASQRRCHEESREVDHLRTLASTLAQSARNDAYHWVGAMADKIDSAGRDAVRGWRLWIEGIASSSLWAGAELVRESRKDVRGVRGALRETGEARIEEARASLVPWGRVAGLRRWVEDARAEVAGVRRLLAANDPATRLAEGYAVLLGRDGRWLRSRLEVQEQTRLLARMHDGEVELEVRDGR
jgi:exodeoxyribonuclease VII large subunit